MQSRSVLSLKRDWAFYQREMFKKNAHTHTALHFTLLAFQVTSTISANDFREHKVLFSIIIIITAVIL